MIRNHGLQICSLRSKEQFLEGANYKIILYLIFCFRHSTSQYGPPN